MALTLHLVRHGQSQWNLDGRVQGQAPDAPGLTALGHAQAAEVAAFIAGSGRIDALRTSDLLRARETAEPIAAVLGLAPIADARLREQAMGEFEGELSTEAFRWWRDDTWTDDSRLGRTGESSNEIRARLESLRSDLLAEATGGGDRAVVLVSHGGAIRHLVALLLAAVPQPSFDWDGDQVANGQVTTAVVEAGRLVELTWIVPAVTVV